jgi:hypothetical protein
VGGLGVLTIMVAAFAVLMWTSDAAFASGDANEASCANEASPGFRTYLADCRAYEMVTPPYKGGATLGEFTDISPDGSRLISESIGAFAGAENDGLHFNFGAIYALERGSAGWTAYALEPPASQYPEAVFEGASTDLRSSLWMLHLASRPSGLEELYLRTPNGVFTRVGPGDAGSTAARTTPAIFNNERIRVLGASPDLRHILFKTFVSNEPPSWPGDTTITTSVVESLYEYSGTENTEPRLVGVSNEGALEGHPHVNEGAKLISDCGTVLGGQVGQTTRSTMYNAISEAGSTVFFTALHREGEEGCPTPTVNELYARVNGVKTVDISEPPLTTPGRECTETCAEDEMTEADRNEGVFEGASRDGTKVFFRTAQPLVNGDHDTGEDLYEVELEGSSIKRLMMVSRGGEGDATPGSGAEVQGVAMVSEDGSHVYFVAKGVLTTRRSGEGHEAQAGQDNLYAFNTRDGDTSFVATLSAKDEADWELGRGRVQATPDGRFLVFASSADLTRDDESGEEAPQIFEYDAQADRLMRVSIGQNGIYNNDGNTNSPTDAPETASQSYLSQDFATTAASQLTVSEDGSLVFFRSRNSLTPQAVGGDMNVYEYHNGNVYLVSDGHDPTVLIGRTPAVDLLGIDASGKDVFFSTADPLVPQDTDTQQDFYDARVEGGFPGPASPAACLGDTCQGPLSAAPSLLSPSSATQPGTGNLTVPVASKPAVKRKSLTRAQKLHNALKACRARRNKKKRMSCETQAKKRYGSTPKAKKTNRRGK